MSFIRQDSQGWESWPEYGRKIICQKATQLQKEAMSGLFRGPGIFKPLRTTRIDDRVYVREWIANIYSRDGKALVIDAGYKYDRLKEKMGWP